MKVDTCKVRQAAGESDYLASRREDTGGRGGGGEGGGRGGWVIFPTVASDP